MMIWRSAKNLNVCNTRKTVQLKIYTRLTSSLPNAISLILIIRIYDDHQRKGNGWLARWLVGHLVGWLVDCFVGWLVGWLVSWLVDWLYQGDLVLFKVIII